LKELEKYPSQIGIDFTSNTQDTADISWAEALVAKIGDLDDQDTAEGTQCLPNNGGARGDNACSQKNDNFEDFSLRLNHEYKVGSEVKVELKEEIKRGSSVMLAIADYGHYGANRGG
jgi:type IV secretion system protein VirB6